MEYQVRRYRVAEGKLDAFVDAWRSGVVPLRQNFGFTIEGAWSIPETNEFVWVMSFDGPEGFAAADAAYYESDERSTLDPNPTVFLENHITHPAFSAL